MPSNDPRKKSKKGATSAKAWKSNKAEMELTLPSGNVCLVKRPGMPQLMAAKVLPDVLTPMADKAITAAKGGVTPTDAEINKELESSFDSQEKIFKVLKEMGKVVAFVVVDPPVKYHERETEEGSGIWEEIPEEDRDENFLYTDYVDMDDQMFIFNFVVGGSADLTEFRRELGESMAGLDALSASEENPS